jgi:hypothetical protein
MCQQKSQITILEHCRQIWSVGQTEFLTLYRKSETRQATYVQRNMQTRSRNHYSHWKAITTLTLVIRHVNRVFLRRIILSYVVCLTRPYYTTISHKWHNFRKQKKFLNKKCAYWFSPQLSSETFLILRRIQQRYCHKFENVSIIRTR